MQFGWPPVSDVAAVTKVRVKTQKPLKFAGCPKLPNRSQPLVGRSSPYCGGIGLLLFNKFFPDCPSCSCSCHFFSLCQLPTLTIHNSLSLSLPAQDLPLPQIFPPHRLPSSLRTDSTDFTTGPFLLSISVLFLVSSLFFFVWFPCGRLSWLHVSFWAHVNIVHHIITAGTTS